MTTRPKRAVPTHYLRTNDRVWTPPCVISFDTETVSHFEGDDEVMTLRLWSARLTDRRAPKRFTAQNITSDGIDGEDFAIWVHAEARKRKTVWAYAHNLGFDLCTSGLIDRLLEFGWNVTEFAVNSGSPFVRLRCKDTVLTLTDSWSWFQSPLEAVADAMNMRKPPLPKDTDTIEQWRERCQADVTILHAAMLELMDWWDNEQLGNWNITGSASGWNALRHIPTSQRILIRTDESEGEFDRRGIYGGRRQVWQSGGDTYGAYTEIDLEKAYTTVCRFLPLPCGRQARFSSLPTDHKWVDSPRWGILAECTIKTDVSAVPVRILNSVWYPVGQFRTVLAGPDIKEARDNGRLVEIGEGWLHHMGYSLRPWATWCLDSMREDNTAVPGVAKLVHRVWARSAVGKWAQRGFNIVEMGPSPNDGWHYEEAWHHGKNVPAGIIDFAGTRYQVAATAQSDNAYPAILAFVESYVRVALGRCITATGDSHMVACDTDGYICDDVGRSNLDSANQACAPLHARPKRYFRRIKVIGPQHIELDKTRRLSGIPRGAVKRSDGKLEARLWPKMAWQLANGRKGAYIRPRQTYKLAATYATGWVLADGSVVPVEMRLSEAGTNELVPWAETRYAASGLALAPYQNRHLKGLWDDCHTSGHSQAA